MALVAESFSSASEHIVVSRHSKLWETSLRVITCDDLQNDGAIFDPSRQGADRVLFRVEGDSARDVKPTVGLRPTTPLRCAGYIILPHVW